MSAAKAKTSAKPPGSLTSPVALTLAEPHPYLAKIKPGLAKRFSLTRMASLFDAVGFAWYLVALGRQGEARLVVDHIATAVPFTGNYNLWTPASKAIALAARLARMDGDEPARSALVGRIVEHPAFATMDRPRFEGWMAKDAKAVTEARDEASQKWACHQASVAAMSAGYFRETLGVGFYYDSWTSEAALDETIEAALAVIVARLSP